MPATPVFHFSARPNLFARTLLGGSRPPCCRTPRSTPLCCNPHVTERLCKKGCCVACQRALSAPQARKLSQSGGGRQSGDNRDSAAAKRTAASRGSGVFKAASARGKGPERSVGRQRTRVSRRYPSSGPRCSAGGAVSRVAGWLAWLAVSWAHSGLPPSQLAGWPLGWSPQWWPPFSFASCSCL